MRYRPTLFLGRWSGVEIRLDLLVVGLIGILFISSLNDARGAPATQTWSAVAHLALLVAMLLCMFAHELGHALMCKLRGHEPTMILLSFVGLTFFKAGKVKGKDEFWIALAGPMVNLGIALATAPFIVLAMTERGAPPVLSLASMATFYGFLAWLSILNFAVAALNLLPGWPADGARAIRGRLARKYGYAAGTVRAVAISHGFWLILAGVSVIIMVLAPAIRAWTSADPTRSPASMIVMYNILLLVFAVLGLFYGQAEKRRVARLGAEKAAEVVGPPPEFMPRKRTKPATEDDPTGSKGDKQEGADSDEIEQLKKKAKETVTAGKIMWKAARASGKGTGWMLKQGGKALGGALGIGPDKGKKGDANENRDDS